jgi:ADP-heptose:LPS heptosyltransferase
VLLFPIVDAIASEQPHTEIVMFVSGAGKNIALHPAVSKVYVQPWIPRQNWIWPVNVFASLLLWRRNLRHLQFDYCIMPRGGVDPHCSAFLAWMLGARERIGYTSNIEPERSHMDMNPSPLLTREAMQGEGIHELERGSDVLMLAGITTVPIDPCKPSPGLLSVANGTEGRQFVGSFEELRKPYFVISPGASMVRRQWPIERFVELSGELVSRGWMPVLVGGRDVLESCARIAASIGVQSLNLAGRTNFAQLAAVCAGAKCFLGNDSGTGHMAGACGVPTLVISPYPKTGRRVHQISPARIRPSGPLVKSVQPKASTPPCVEECVSDKVHCISAVTVDEAGTVLKDLLQRCDRAEGLRCERLGSIWNPDNEPEATDSSRDADPLRG